MGGGSKDEERYVLVSFHQTGMRWTVLFPTQKRETLGGRELNGLTCQYDAASIRCR